MTGLFGESPDGGDILEEDEYLAILNALENAGVKDPEKINEIVQQFEKATMQVSLLDALTEGIATFETDETGEVIITLGDDTEDDPQFPDFNPNILGRN